MNFQYCGPIFITLGLRVSSLKVGIIVIWHAIMYMPTTLSFRSIVGLEFEINQCNNTKLSLLTTKTMHLETGHTRTNLAFFASSLYMSEQGCSVTLCSNGASLSVRHVSDFITIVEMYKA